MATMTIAESERVFNIVLAAFGDTSHRHTPVSALKGYDIYQICTALKLKIANCFLLYAGRDDFEEKFAKLVNFCEGGPGLIMMCVVPDDQADVIVAKHVFDFEDPQYLSQETIGSFGGYCRTVGSEDPMYWQKIYTRLGLEYTSTSPKRNDLVFPESLSDLSTPDPQAKSGCLASVVILVVSGFGLDSVCLGGFWPKQPQHLTAVADRPFVLFNLP